MPAGTGPQRQLHPVSVGVKEEVLDAMLKDFPCEACGQYMIHQTQRESWYTCVNCGYSFGVEPFPKRRVRVADFPWTGSTLH
jgi:predicted RNA-binding Zn-ribbon protein involved in translation (DUF1610 family)